MLRSILRCPVFRIGIVRCKPRQNSLIVRHFVVHIPHRGFGLLQPLAGLRPLLQNDGIPRPQVFLGFLQQAQAALLLNVLDGCTAALQALDALHSIDGFLVEHPAVAAVTLTGQQPPVRIEPQRMLRTWNNPAICLMV